MSSRTAAAHDGAVSLLLWQAIQDAAKAELIFDFDGLNDIASAEFCCGLAGRMVPRLNVIRASAMGRLAWRFMQRRGAHRLFFAGARGPRVKRSAPVCNGRIADYQDTMIWIESIQNRERDRFEEFRAGSGLKSADTSIRSNTRFSAPAAMPRGPWRRRSQAERIGVRRAMRPAAGERRRPRSFPQTRHKRRTGRRRTAWK